MKDWLKRLIVLGIITCSSVMFVACEQQGPAEEVGEGIDEAAEETQEGVEEAGEEIEEQTDQ